MGFTEVKIGDFNNYYALMITLSYMLLSLLHD
jgi:hypothetical protein